MPREPYMPDSARASMPHSAMQPLPPYLREDFAQSLDRTRPHELVLPVINGKRADPKRLSSLQYRYLDNNELTTVPNCWYNQTQEMRVEWWAFEVERTSASLAQARAELAMAKACTAPFFRDTKTEKAVQQAEWTVQYRQRLAETVAQLLQDVKAGVKFC